MIKLVTVIGKSLAVCMLMSLCCCGHMQKFELSVYVDPAVRTAEGNFPRIPVDIVGVTDGEDLAKFKDQLVDAWFTPGNDLRRAAKEENRMSELTFGAGLANPQSLLLTDPVWEQWEKRKCTNLVVFASFPRASSAAQDDRRPFIIPLSSKQWDNPSKVQLTVRISEMLTNPQFKAAS